MSVNVVLPNEETLRDEWFIQPILPTIDAPREWYKSEDEAVAIAKLYAEQHSCPYEVYKRTHYIYAD